MQRLFLLLLILCAILTCGCGDSTDFSQRSPGQTSVGWKAPDPALLAVDLQRDIDASLAANDIPGALVGVWTPNGTWASATGLADVDGQTAMSLADHSAWRSITKSLTVTVVLELVAEGKLKLDAPVGTYLQGVPNGAVITLRQLANMTSGLFNYTADDDFKEALGSDLTRAWTTPEILSYAFAHDVNFAAGTEYDYSNTNTLVLGEVAETVTGQSIESLIQARVLGPLGLDHSVYATGTQLPSPAAHGYTFDDDTAQFVELVSNATALGAAGAMAGTLDDLHVWGRALALGSLLPAELQAQRFVGRPPTNGPEYDQYGLGMGEIRGWWGHTGTGLGYQASTFTDPVTGSSVVILVNGTNSDPDVPAHLFRQILVTLGWPG